MHSSCGKQGKDAEAFFVCLREPEGKGGGSVLTVNWEVLDFVSETVIVLRDKPEEKIE
ncbi:hypothetical protein HMPREF0322_04974 [Desulfitobacterium hafniense DP7]|uniref:Uncharacterized protein n=1 Tax=Desulfitobacterium hafniense DP7 TaxID=537010 RepID=G9XVG1_DESHA|nr:hypothetical protein HMPREF0322_04974 [Desulfitobacterium hafniense DP7]